MKNYKIQRNSGHSALRCACRRYYEVKYKIHFYFQHSRKCSAIYDGQKEEMFSKQLYSLHFYIYQFVSNSHLLVLCREQRHFKNIGIVTHWNRTAYFEFGNSLRKYRIKYLTNSVVYHLDSVTINDKKSFLYKPYILCW